MKTQQLIFLLALGLCLSFFQACKTKTSTNSKKESTMHTKGGKSEASRNFESGCKLLPREGLLKAIAEAKAAKQVWKIPVVIQRGQFGDAGTCFIGVADGLSASDRVEITLDDSRLGISLSDRMRAHCGEASPCLLWLEGTWGTVLELPGTSDSDKPVFGIHSVVDAPKDAATTNKAAFVYISR